MTHGPWRGPAVCPHCWMVNPGPFELCSRCGASMRTILQETAGLRRAAPVQSPVPVGVGRRLSLFQRALLALFVACLAMTYLVQLLPPAPRTVEAPPPGTPAGMP